MSSADSEAMRTPGRAEWRPQGGLWRASRAREPVSVRVWHRLHSGGRQRDGQGHLHREGRQRSRVDGVGQGPTCVYR